MHTVVLEIKEDTNIDEIKSAMETINNLFTYVINVQFILNTSSKGEIHVTSPVFHNLKLLCQSVQKIINHINTIVEDYRIETGVYYNNPSMIAANQNFINGLYGNNGPFGGGFPPSAAYPCRPSMSVPGYQYPNDYPEHHRPNTPTSKGKKEGQEDR